MAMLVCINIQAKFKGLMAGQANKENITYMDTKYIHIYFQDQS